jgi:tRNA(fMet)-specific endonuclease VapC
MYFLDTNTCVYFLKGTYRSILKEFKKKKPEEIKIPAMVKAELLLGAEKSERKEENLNTCKKFLEPFEIVGFDDQAATIYAKIRASLERKGTLIGPNDMIIASTVMARKGILISHNVREFKQIPGLQLQDWVRENR